jgi:hypothetical protein
VSAKSSFKRRYGQIRLSKGVSDPKEGLTGKAPDFSEAFSDFL